MKKREGVRGCQYLCVLLCDVVPLALVSLWYNEGFRGKGILNDLLEGKVNWGLRLTFLNGG